MIFFPTATRVDRSMRLRAGAPPRGLDHLSCVAQVALALVIIPLILLAFTLVGGGMAGEWLVRRSREAIRRNAHRIGRGMRWRFSSARTPTASDAVP
jgi:hypothetical protein